jgi:2-phospho-L-lactate guanylyltransferase
MGSGPAFVADRQGTGTTAYAAARREFTPAFGAASAARHRASGAAEVARDLVTLRLDVDDEPSLATAGGVGLGPHTRAALDAAGRLGRGDRS